MFSQVLWGANRDEDVEEGGEGREKREERLQNTGALLVGECIVRRGGWLSPQHNPPCCMLQGMAGRLSFCAAAGSSSQNLSLMVYCT